MAKDGLNFNIVNAQQLSRKLGKLDPKQWRKPMRKAMSNEFKDVRAKMREKVPTRSKRLRKSIQTDSWTIERNNGDLDIFVRTGPTLRGRGRKNGFTAHFAEFGTKHHKAQPFVFPTFQSVKAIIPAKFTAALKQILDL
jgi:HK97 gp10 family phage protein